MTKPTRTVCLPILGGVLGVSVVLVGGCRQQGRSPAASQGLDSNSIASFAIEEGRRGEPQPSTEASVLPLGIACFTRINGGAVVTLKRIPVAVQRVIELADFPLPPIVGVTAEGKTLTLAPKWAVEAKPQQWPTGVSDSTSQSFARRTGLVQVAESLVQGEVGRGRRVAQHCVEDVSTGLWVTIVAADALTSEPEAKAKGWIVGVASNGAGRVIARLY
jgi:hypothetical protein